MNAARLPARGSIVLALCLVASAATGAQPDWKPDRTVEIIVGTAPGAAPDRTARSIQRTWQTRGIFDGPVNVVNKPGGGNVVAWTYLNQHPGNPHYLMIGNLNAIISRAIGISPYAASDYTWVAMLFDEYFAVSVRADSPIASGRDLVARLQKDPGSMTVGVSTSIGSGNHLSAALAFQRAGVDPRRVKFVAFKGSADSITALLGGHVDAVSTAVSAAVPHVRSAQLRTVAVSSARRLGAPLAEVPTWSEQGAAAVVSNFRAVIAPKGTAADATAFWQSRFAQLSETPEWKSDLEKNLWSANFMDSANATAAIAVYVRDVDALVGALGLRKQPR
jgi:putative tricarboxylic transport membrane protein